MIDEKELEMYLSYTKTVWNKIKEMYKNEPIEAQAIAFERATSPIKYWLEEQKVQDKKIETVVETAKKQSIIEIAQKYNLIIEKDRIVTKKGGYESNVFHELCNAMEELGYKYQKGKGYFTLEV